jgi:dTDP-4-dehydrorhamnose reductase
VRVLVTGGTGFVGSNVVAVAADRGHEVFATVRAPPPLPDPRCTYVPADLVDVRSLAGAVAAARPNVVVHTAILNDFHRLYAERELAWRSYVGATHALADAANEAGAVLVYVSTDWVFDGTRHLAAEDAPPNPVNYYGVLKAISETVTLERSREPVVTRISGVMGRHRARPAAPRAQDPGFGYFVDAVVDALARGEAFTVWESETINAVATPSLASASGELILLAAERGLRGIYHCCGGEPSTRRALAQAAAEVFELDRTLLRFGPPPPDALPPAPIPYDTSLDAGATAAALGVELPTVRELLRRFRDEREAAPQ